MAEGFADLALRVMAGARWFAGKGRPVRVVRVLPLPWTVHRDDPAPGALVGVRSVLVVVAHDDVHPVATDTYQFLLAVRRPGPAEAPGAYGPCHDTSVTGAADPLEVADATRDPEAMAAVLTALAGSAAPSAGPSDLHPSSDTGAIHHHLLVPLPAADLRPRPFTGEQSNSSVFYGEALILKVFRRLEIGHNLDIVVHEALGRDAAGGTAVLYGWSEARWTDGRQVLGADLAMLTERFHDAHDGWRLALDACAAGADFSTEAEALGRTLRLVHEGLARQFPTEDLDGDALAAAMTERLDTAQRTAPALRPYAPALRTAFAVLAGRRVPAQHVHGDFHLGQVLRTTDGWRVIDFEGEPLKTLAERWAPDSRWRDVAGMLRSFDYASAAARPASAALARTWRQRCRTGFLSGYCGGPPATSDLAVLRAYEADKAVYEVVYEVRNRPDWVEIPLAAVAELASPSSDPSGGQSPNPEEK
ncbi:maltokinase N-terminal cap-like domain-containing protein [Raineyella sp. LH-20]|uniref:maltokinase N-terminal cap-like domain-containing protein n=1 Tax=Raineyella sp. LH-20 TaxID=3081204 RepID=UPI0029534C2E|nr:phosphotransferase [Raineyella sp. LH-20]WOP17941.1 phosphotransferase [Raineyella sp. LH-20]